MKKVFTFVLLFISFFALSQQQDKELKALSHQFDFWLGKWDVYKFGTETLAGKSHIESINDSTGILENYTNATGKYSGKSLNKYNVAKQRWEQYWIDNSGLTLHLTGGFINGKMILSDEISGDPKQGINQIIWEKLENGNVRQTWNLSTNGGKTWKVQFDGEYKKSK
jgi:hypothetical protein